MKDSLLFLRRGLVSVAFTGAVIAMLSYSAGDKAARANKSESRGVVKELRKTGESAKPTSAENNHLFTIV